MTEQTYPIEDVTSSEPSGELVHWMEPGPLRVGVPGLSATAAGAFLLGMGVGAAALAIAHWMGRDR